MRAPLLATCSLLALAAAGVVCFVVRGDFAATALAGALTAALVADLVAAFVAGFAATLVAGFAAALVAGLAALVTAFVAGATAFLAGAGFLAATGLLTAAFFAAGREAGVALALALAEAGAAADARVLRAVGAAALLVFFAVLLTFSFMLASRCLILAQPASRHFSRQAKAMRFKRGSRGAPQNRDSLYQTLFQSVDKYVFG